MLPDPLLRNVETARGSGLLITRNHLAFVEALRSAAPGVIWTVRTKEDLRGWGPRRMVALLRSESWSRVVLEDDAEEGLRRRDLYRMLLVLARGGTRWLVGTPAAGGQAERVTRTRTAPALLGAGFAESAATLGGLYRADRLTRRLDTPRPLRRIDRAARPRVAVIKTDFWFGVRAGGSVTHLNGVLRGLRESGFAPHLWSSVPVPGAEDVAEVTVVDPPPRPAMVEEAAMAAYNTYFLDHIRKGVRAFDPGFVYQRHAVFSVAGLALARELDIPLVLEINASEVWAREAWSRLQFAGLARRMEGAAVRHADRLTLVSEALREPMISLGAPADRVVVSSNGVDVRRFDPGSRSESLRASLGFTPDDVVCGFIGTFHKWHGVLFLGDQTGPLHQADGRLKFLLMGDGEFRPETESRVSAGGAGDAVRFTGMLRPDQVPEHLAACDILLSPHLPFEDGTEFFGSPTKLFEYLAAGRPVVASRLGQIGTVVAHGETGCLVTPGDAAAFRTAVLDLARDTGLRESMGRAARAAAEKEHTWTANLGRSLDGMIAP